MPTVGPPALTVLSTGDQPRQTVAAATTEKTQQPTWDADEILRVLDYRVVSAQPPPPPSLVLQEEVGQEGSRLRRPRRPKDVLDVYVASAHNHFQEVFMMEWTRMLEGEKDGFQKVGYLRQQLKLQRDFETFLIKVQNMYKEIKE